jgi:endonuclease/exonuclease/phosphatase family metal-dependent hydrolase
VDVAADLDPTRHRRIARWASTSAAIVGWAAAAAGSVVLAARWSAIDPPPVPVIVATAPAVALVAVGLGLVALAVCRSARLGVVLGVVVVAGLVTWWPIVSGPSPTSEAEPNVRVATWNMAFSNPTPAEGIETLLDAEPDLLALQEVTLAHQVALDSTDLVDDLPHVRTGAEDGALGWVLASRWPILDHGVDRIDRWPVPWIVVGTPRGRVRFTGVHTPPPGLADPGAWSDQLEALPAVLGDVGAARRIVAGDFNATTDHAAFRAVTAGSDLADARSALGGWGPTWPDGRRTPAFAAIDHVLASRDAEVVDVAQLGGLGSDHRAVVAELHLP